MNIFPANSFRLEPRCAGVVGLLLYGLSWGWLCRLAGGWGRGSALISCNNYKGTLCATRNANLPSTCSYASSSTTTGSVVGRRARFCGSVVRWAGRAYGFIALATRWYAACQSPSQSQSLEAESDPLGNFVLIVLWVAGAQTWSAGWWA